MGVERKKRKEKLLQLLLKAPVSYSSDYLEVRETEIEGKRYRLIKQFAGRGRTRRELAPVLQSFDGKHWRRVLF